MRITPIYKSGQAWFVDKKFILKSSFEQNTHILWCFKVNVRKSFAYTMISFLNLIYFVILLCGYGKGRKSIILCTYTTYLS